MTSVSNELVLCGLSDKSSMYDVKQVFRRFGHIARFILLSENGKLSNPFHILFSFPIMYNYIYFFKIQVESNQSVAILKYKSNESTKVL